MDIVLIPGLWLDGSSWDDVIEHLDHPAHALTLPGMVPGGRRAGITLRDHVDAVVAKLDELAGPVVLVGHSAGATIAHAAVDARPHRVARAIYVDDVPRGAGECINDALPVVDGEIPLPDWDVFDEPDLIDLDRDALRAMAIPSPARVATDPQQLSDDERRYEVPVTVIACEFTPEQLREWMAGGFAAELQRIRSVTYEHLPTGHWPQLTRPKALAAVITRAL
jgi:pimeloyl-ACP methyl ester carboxylesterase